MLNLTQRPRRLRTTPALRDLVAESSLTADHLVYPYFIRFGSAVRQPIVSMPGIHQFSIDMFLADAEELHSHGLRAVMLFGIPDRKDASGSAGWAEDGIVPMAIRALKTKLPGMFVFADVCLCEYTDHGHCGPITASKEVDNDAAVEGYVKASVAYAKAGADFVAPSGMMDGTVGAIRRGLDSAGHSTTGIMGYSAKYASAFYGPFRDAAQSPPQFGDRKSYQMDFRNAREAMKEIALDIEEGADIVMVKPALSYLDIIREARNRFDRPVAAYNVSGEYSMVKAAVEKGWVGPEIALEILAELHRR